MVNLNKNNYEIIGNLFKDAEQKEDKDKDSAKKNKAVDYYRKQVFLPFPVDFNNKSPIDYAMDT